TEVTRDVAFSPAPVDERRALKMIDRLRGRAVLDGYRGRPPADVAELARLVGIISRGVAGLGVREVEINPLIWDGAEWVAVDWLVVGD
ncbi:MAG TPA: acetate--CoA ligase family protein, partial [Acidimicrobiia bacterium]